MRLKKAVKDYMELDSVVTDYFKYVLTFYNIANVRRSNALFEHGSFPMITMNELGLSSQEVHSDGERSIFESTLEIQCDTLIDQDIRNDRSVETLNDILLNHEDACEYVFDKMNRLSLTNSDIRVTNFFVNDCSDSQLIYNLYNDDHDRIIVRKTMSFSVQYFNLTN